MCVCTYVFRNQMITDDGFIFEIHTRVPACDGGGFVRFDLSANAIQFGQIFSSRDWTIPHMQIGCSNTARYGMEYTCVRSRVPFVAMPSGIVHRTAGAREFIIRDPRANRSRVPLAHVCYTDISRIDYRSVARVASIANDEIISSASASWECTFQGTHNAFRATSICIFHVSRTFSLRMRVIESAYATAKLVINFSSLVV